MGFGCFGRPSSPSPAGQQKTNDSQKTEDSQTDDSQGFRYFKTDSDSFRGIELGGHALPHQQPSIAPTQILQQPPIEPIASILEPLVVDDIPGLIRFSYEELVEATEDFSDPLGHGGYGSVFSGNLHGQTVAVKIVYGVETTRGRGSFIAELSCLKLDQLRHQNIINLIGFLATDKNMMLVFEKMPLGSLESHTYNRPSSENNPPPPLDWSTRLNVAKGVGEALELLHHENIIHRDLKSPNILLGDGFVPKLGDFGLAMIVTNSAESIHTEFRGTYGYSDPNYRAYGILSSKSDVYSFGVILLELLTGQEAMDDQTTLVDKARPLFSGDILRLADAKMVGATNAQLLEAFRIAEACLQKDPAGRPTMEVVVQRLSLL